MVHEEMITFRLPKAIKRRIQIEAKARYISEADVAREALISYLKSLDVKKLLESQPQAVAA